MDDLLPSVADNPGLPQPRPGFYLLALVPGGWKVAVEITAVRNGWGLIVDGDHHPLTWNREDVLLAYAEGMLTGELFNHPMLRVVLFGTLVDEAAYLQRLALKEWARRHEPRHPCLYPDRPISRFDTPPPF